MSRTIKQASVERCHYASHEELREHRQTFIDAYYYARRLKTLRGVTPFEQVVKCCNEEPDRFIHYPPHYMPGLIT